MISADNERNRDIRTDQFEKATFAGGCFWCMQPLFDKLEGVVSTEAGYTGGVTENPAYEEVCSGSTGHAEAVEIIFDPLRISYEKLLDVFWHNIDPTTLNAQFVDRGSQYRTAIFYHTEGQKRMAETSKAKLENTFNTKSGKLKKPIVTEITPASTFYRAEDHHQKYYLIHTYRYNTYKYGSGREQQLKKIWEMDLKK